MKLHSILVSDNRFLSFYGNWHKELFLKSYILIELTLQKQSTVEITLFIASLGHQIVFVLKGFLNTRKRST